MDRPTLNPSIHLELDRAPPPRKRFRLLRKIVVLLLLLLKLLFTPLSTLLGLSRTQPLPGDEDHSPYTRFLRALIYRAAAFAVVLALLIATLVYSATHPTLQSTHPDPSSLGLYFQRVTLISSDAVASPAWFTPALDSARILENPAKALETQSPAIILVHDQGLGPDQFLDYLRPLHAAGMVTLTLSPRAGGQLSQSFGLREAADVRAAIAFLRTKPAVNPRRIALLGIGTGATASLLAAREEPGLAAIVAISPPPDTKALLEPLSPQNSALHFLRPVSRWAFESALNVDANDADLTRLSTALHAQNVLYLLPPDHALPPSSQRTTALHFLTSHLTPAPVAATEP